MIKRPVGLGGTLCRYRSGEIRGKLGWLGPLDGVVKVEGPTGAAVNAAYAVRGTAAVVELAQSSGLQLLPGGERAPLVASTFGLGQTIAAAIDDGATSVVVGLEEARAPTAAPDSSKHSAPSCWTSPDVSSSAAEQAWPTWLTWTSVRRGREWHRSV